jgi:putative DNA primase/helicase
MTEGTEDPKKSKKPLSHSARLQEIIEKRQEIVDLLTHKHHFVTLEKTRELFVQIGGVFRGENYPKNIIGRCCASILGIDLTKNDIEDVTTIIKENSYVPNDFFDRVPLEIINVTNGCLNINTKEFSETFDYAFLYKIPTVYDPKATCPAIEKFLMETVGPIYVDMTYEIFGYCLWRAYPLQKFFIFLGKGANGRTTLLNLIISFLGKENVKAIPLDRLASNRFAMAELYGKLANICGETSIKPIKYTDLIKTLTGDDQLSAEKKFVQGSLDFVNHAKLAFNCNELPGTPSDDSDGWWRRPQIIEFKNSFTEEQGNRVQNIIETLTTPEELSGLLNKAIDGLKRLLLNGQFTNEDCSSITRDRWMGADTVAAFRNKYVVINLDVGAFEVKAVVYDRYVTFCDLNGFPALDHITFGKKFVSLTKCKSAQRTVAGNVEWVYANIRLKPEVPPSAPEYGDELSGWGNA